MILGSYHLVEWLFLCGVFYLYCCISYLLERPIPTLPVPPVPPPTSISPGSDGTKNLNRRSRKSERPLPTKSLPVTDSQGTAEGSVFVATPEMDSACNPPVDTDSIQRKEEEDEDTKEVSASSEPQMSESCVKEVSSDRKDKKEFGAVNQSPRVADQRAANVEPTVPEEKQLQDAGGELQVQDALSCTNVSSGVPLEGGVTMGVMTPQSSRVCTIFMYLFWVVCGIQVLFRQ